MKPAKSRKIVLLNFLGSVGYVACLFQWMWTLLIFLPTILESGLFQAWFRPVTPAAPEVTNQVTTNSSAAIPGYVALAVLLLGIVVALWALYAVFAKLPRTVARTGEKVTHTVAETITPIITRHIPIPEKQRKEIPELIIVIIKLVIVFMPLCLLLFAHNLSLSMSFELIMVIGVLLFCWAFLFFALQYIASKLVHVDYKKVR